jgi:hypothetical protein
MTNRGVANGGVQAGHPDQQEQMDEGAEPGKDDDVQERNHEDLSPVTGPAPPRAYNGYGRLVPAPALPAVDLTI